MRFCRADEVRLSRSEPIFRESPWIRFAAWVAFAALGVVPLVIALRAGARAAGWIFGIATAAMMLGALIFLKMFFKTLSADNWLVGVTTSGDIAIKFRSFANAHFPREGKVVMILERAHGDIQFVRARRQDIKSAGSGGDTETSKRIVLELGVAPELAAEAHAQVTAERRREAPQRGRFIKSRTRTLHYPVTVEGSVIRIEWRGAHTWITPRVEHAVAAIARITKARVESEQHDDIDDTELSKDKAESRILELTERGETIAAIELTRRIYNLPLGEAKQFVEGLLSSKPQSARER